MQKASKEAPRWAEDRQRHDYIVEDFTPSPDGNGGVIAFNGGWQLSVPSPASGVQIEEGAELTVFGKGMGYGVRGVLVNDQEVYYRTEAEDGEHFDRLMYGENAEDWLQRWDSGKGVWTVRLGGISAGYDQAINIMVAEFLRLLLKDKPVIEGEYVSEELTKAMFEAAHDDLVRLGMSGAQRNAAFGFAVQLYRFGPIQMIKKAPEDRRVQASKHYPCLVDTRMNKLLDKMLAQFEVDPATTDYQRGFKACLDALKAS